MGIKVTVELMDEPGFTIHTVFPKGLSLASLTVEDKANIMTIMSVPLSNLKKGDSDVQIPIRSGGS